MPAPRTMIICTYPPVFSTLYPFTFGYYGWLKHNAVDEGTNLIYPSEIYTTN